MARSLLEVTAYLPPVVYGGCGGDVVGGVVAVGGRYVNVDTVVAIGTYAK